MSDNIGKRARLPRFQVTWRCWYKLGATRAVGEKVYYFHAADERGAVADARDAMRNADVEPEGPPSVRKVHD
jgi:hypothetical protein